CFLNVDGLAVCVSDVKYYLLDFRCNLVWLEHSSLVLPVVFWVNFLHLCSNFASAYRHDSDSLAGRFSREVLCQSHHTKFACAIRGQVLKAGLGGSRADVDYGAGLHMWQGRL